MLTILDFRQDSRLSWNLLLPGLLASRIGITLCWADAVDLVPDGGFEDAPGGAPSGWTHHLSACQRGLPHTALAAREAISRENKHDEKQPDREH